MGVKSVEAEQLTVVAMVETGGASKASKAEAEVLTKIPVVSMGRSKQNGQAVKSKGKGKGKDDETVMRLLELHAKVYGEASEKRRRQIWGMPRHELERHIERLEREMVEKKLKVEMEDMYVQYKRSGIRYGSRARFDEKYDQQKARTDGLRNWLQEMTRDGEARERERMERADRGRSCYQPWSWELADLEKLPRGDSATHEAKSVAPRADSYDDEDENCEEVRSRSTPSRRRPSNRCPGLRQRASWARR
jgi:hypothetical protein